MFACCNFCNVKYMNKDRTFDMVVLKKAFGASAEVITENRVSKLKVIKKIDQTDLSFEELQLVMEGKELPEFSENIYQLCTGPSHIKGLFMDH